MRKSQRAKMAQASKRKPDKKASKLTPEQEVRIDEQLRDEERASYPDDPVIANQNPIHDNWALWLTYQMAKKLIGDFEYEVGLEVADFRNADGTPDILGIAKELKVEPNYVEDALFNLVELGAAFSRINDWPHPLTGATRSQDKQSVH